MPKLLLFDIDGTLVLTGGAGLRAMTRACEDIIGHADALEGIPVAGRTDWIILHDTLARLGRQLDQDLFHQLRDRYVAYLREEIMQPGKGFNGALPGVAELLDALHPRQDVFLALLTGNFEAGARIKLERFDLWRYFRCGAFGDDAADRNHLVPVAVERAEACGIPRIAPADVLVVGDTPHDVACAKAAGATAVGVATGGYTADDLRACGAAIVFDTLRETDRVLDTLGV
ncbi:MAG TPA: HAD hydrolase-like protein [Vicinamibacterales bacterium]|jgi:phosphoglycolate phosphatase-like HAD superfamily hydrolase|nr:HAD hydrolase-like protein [Vicinamibacterales bacterium]